MNACRFISALFFMVAVSLLASCGSGANEKAAAAAADSTAAADSIAKAKAAAANTIVTTPENVVVVTHKVANYAKWLVSFEAHDSAKLANGMHNYVIGRGLMDSNMLMVALKVDDTAKAKAFEKDPRLKELMKKAGVIGAPTMTMVTTTWQDTATIATDLRSMVSLTVKDWDTFLKAFEAGKQDRTDNGVAARVVSHDLDDNKKVHVVTAITDTAKAFAWYKSDALKKHWEAEGVVGQPVRFIYRLVKKY